MPRVTTTLRTPRQSNSLSDHAGNVPELRPRLGLHRPESRGSIRDVPELLLQSPTPRETMSGTQRDTSFLLSEQDDDDVICHKCGRWFEYSGGGVTAECPSCNRNTSTHYPKYWKIGLVVGGEECHACGSTDQLHVHHKDRDRENNDVDNLIPLCASCHSKVHHGSADGNVVIAALKARIPEKDQ